MNHDDSIASAGLQATHHESPQLCARAKPHPVSSFVLFCDTVHFTVQDGTKDTLGSKAHLNEGCACPSKHVRPCVPMLEGHAALYHHFNLSLEAFQLCMHSSIAVGHLLHRTGHSPAGRMVRWQAKAMHGTIRLAGLSMGLPLSLMLLRCQPRLHILQLLLQRAHLSRRRRPLLAVLEVLQQDTCLQYARA
jgi:hypothetical protein